eukprot:CAMPEP_0194508412 /NCGR_PEP_ID=MMETSP0253-20130528/38609_1 /TAXON_ID=2966 /ORGANISM="Noctiluca scintillans" /LENGTH=90 /DNA_ID=CAMNT_0039351449 /DNA_START=1145 /DNA_END=1413 /DNA_ORIENTATION=-
MASGKTTTGTCLHWNGVYPGNHGGHGDGVHVMGPEGRNPALFDRGIADALMRLASPPSKKPASEADTLRGKPPLRSALGPMLMQTPPRCP